MRLLRSISIIFVLAIVGLVAIALFIAQRETLVRDGQISVSELQHSAQVYFDRLSVPYIEARSEKDLTIAQGFITASERLFQMDLLRRLTKGEMAAVFGQSCLGSDKLMHTLGFKRIAEAEYSQLSPETKDWLKSYCQGVNAFIAQGRQKHSLEFILLGYEPQAWQPEDTLAILRYLQYASDECWQLNSLRNSIAQKAGSEFANQLFNSPLSTDGSGCVLAKKWSHSTGNLLAYDKHTIATFPDLFFACSLRAPFFHVAGVSIPGIPGILFGRNDHIGWGAISMKEYCQYLHFEKFSTKYPNQYEGSQGWTTTREYQEEISQRFGPRVLEKFFSTENGPVLTKNNDIAVSLSWYGFRPANNIIEAIRPLNKAKNVAEFKAALQKYKGNKQMFVYADTAGSIGKQLAGHSAQQSINNEEVSDPTPSADVEDSIIISNDNAAERVDDLLTASKVTNRTLALENLIAILGDTHARFSKLVCRTIKNAVATTNSIDQYQHESLNMLSNWDEQLKANSASACLYESFLVSITKRILQTKIGDKLTEDYINKYPGWTNFTRYSLEQQPNNLLPSGQRNFSVFILNCFSQSLKNLRFIFNTGLLPGHMQRCQWQKLHQLDFGINLAKFIPNTMIAMLGPFLPPVIGVAGDQDCINSCNYQISQNSPFFICSSVPTARLLIDMADNDKFYQSLSSKQCGHLFANDKIDNTADQLNSWSNLEFHALAFSPKQLKQLACHNLILSNSNE